MSLNYDYLGVYDLRILHSIMYQQNYKLMSELMINGLFKVVNIPH
jgi:hypothetical protein